MASTSSSSIEKSSFKYDVFLSFRGEDTRKNFVDHLYHALHHKSIHTYKDDERIKKGERISDELITSIQDSRFYIIIFSKNYASSSWCLDELVKIMECHKTTIHTAYPVFYDVEPTEIRKQIGSVGEAFSKHEKQDAAAAAKWREALKEAADLAGWELKNTLDGHEAKFIQKIVEEISLELRFIDSSVDGKLIGMESRVKGVVSALEIGSADDVRMIGIKGIGGGGKTTLARAVFDHISIQFEGQSFVENVREVSKASLSGLKKLQKQILSDVLNDQGIKVSGVHEGKNIMKKMICGRKVLLVLDDVDNIEQLEALAGEHNWFKPGSRIIITTRDEQVLVAHRVNLIHDVNLLSDNEAVCLFSRYAFGREIPIQGYEELSRQVVCYAAGLPLTVRVLGSFLCGKNELEWKDAIDRLKTIPLRETLEKLELSYIGLEEDYKEIFLDVACILKGWIKSKAVEVIESCGFHARNGLRVLEQRSLITISKYGYLGMHDHIEEMGKNIVRRLHPSEPYRHSRLWIQEEIDDILANDLGTEATRCIKMEVTHKTHNSLETLIKCLGNMKKLRVLDITGNADEINSREELGPHLPNGLRYLRWENFPSESLMKSFQENNLVGLSLIADADLKQFWKCGERKVLKKLRFLDFTALILRRLDLEMIPNIETVSLKCRDLVELHMPFECLRLKTLNLENCMMLRTLNLGSTPNLETLSLQNCYNLSQLHMPIQCPKLKSLVVNFSKLRTLNLGLIPDLEMLIIEGCHDLLEFHMPFRCPKLKALSLNCPKLRTLEFGPTLDLETLSIQGCDLLELHMPNESPNLKSLYVNSSNLRTLNLEQTTDLETLSLGKCPNLKELNMPFGCPKLKCISLLNSTLRTLNLGSSLDLEMLSLEGCHDLLELHMPFRCLKLKALSLNCSKLRILNMGWTSDLETLILKDCRDLVEFHMPNECPKLKCLWLMNSAMRNLSLGLTPDLETLWLEECHDLLELHMPFRCPKLKVLSLNCSKLGTLEFGSALDLETLSIQGCDLLELHMPNECPNLKSLGIYSSKLRTLNLGQTSDLEILSLENCPNLLELNMPFGCPKLKCLSLLNSMLRTLDLGLTPNLERLYIKLNCATGCLEKLFYLNLSDCEGFKYFLFDKSIRLRKVGGLHLIAESVDICPLHSNSNLQKFLFSCLDGIPIPSLIGNLRKLISVGLCTCTNLESFSESICNLQFLRKLTLEGSISEMPKDLDRLESLEELSLLSEKIQHLPDSICMLKHLKLLRLESCWLIEKLPEELGRLECLEDLYLTDCILLRDVPNSVCELKRLNYFHLPYCMLVEKLPKELGRLECLKELNIEGAGIAHLPQSIFGLKGLRIIGSRWRLQSYGFTSMYPVSPNSSDMVYCYIEQCKT